MSQKQKEEKFTELYEHICKQVKDSTTRSNENLLDDLIEMLSKDVNKINATRDRYENCHSPCSGNEELRN